MENHYFDADGVYTGSAPANDGTLPPDNALRTAPPEEPGFWPVLNETRDGWISVPDHRGEEGWLNGEPFRIVGLGPHPEGWTSEQPDSLAANGGVGADVLYLTRSGTCHRAGCVYTKAPGEWLTPAAVREKRPGAKLCAKCRPEAGATA